MNLRHVVTCVALLLGAACSTQAQLPCPDIDVPAAGGAHILPGTSIGIEYARAGGQALTFDVFRHSGEAARPTAVILRGGRGHETVGARLSFVGQLAEALAGGGYQVVLPDYRATSARDTEDDLVALFQTLRCHGGRLGIDANQVVLIGEDSGGDAALRLTAHLATLRRGRTSRWPPPPRATVSLGGAYDDVPSKIEDASLLVHGTADRQIPIERVNAACAGAADRAQCEVLEVGGASHRVENWWPDQWAYKARVLDWLATRVGPVPSAAWPVDPRLRKGIVFDTDKGLALDAFIPHGPGPFAAAVLVHGGGWEAGDRVTYIAPLFQPLAARGIAWFSIDYRLTPQVDNRAQVEDVARALTYIREHAAEYRVDPARLVLVGESASGQLVSHLATRNVDVAGVVSFYGVYDLLAMTGEPSSPRSLPQRLFGIQQLDDASRATLREYSPLYHVNKDMPPTLLVTGTADGLWPQAQAFEARLKQVGARYDSIVLPDAPHGMEQWNGDQRWRTWSAQVVDWIAKTTAR